MLKSLKQYLDASLQKMVAEAVSSYFRKMVDQDLIRLAPKILGAEGLSEEQYKKFVQTVKNDVVVEIFFPDGAMVVMSSKGSKGKAGPGW